MKEEEKDRGSAIEESDRDLSMPVKPALKAGKELRSLAWNWLVNRKALPFYMVFVVLYVSSFRTENFLFDDGMLNQEILFGRVAELVGVINNSFALGSPIKAFTTVLMVLTLWSIYHYWIKDSGIVEGGEPILRRILLAAVAVTVIKRHVQSGTVISSLSEWIVFVIVLYLELATMWFIAKVLDEVDLSSDLKNWTLRLTGLPVVILGASISLSADPLFSEGLNTGIYSMNVFLAGLMVMIIGGFMIYRSTRREPALKIW